MRLLRTGALDPATNLALDEALLRSGVETLRLYGWDPPGLSVGFFQRLADVPRPEGWTVVRRPTGGGAIAHTGELTIAWIGRRRRVDGVYTALNDAVARALASFGVAVRAGTEQPEAAPAGLCFDAHTCYDLLAGDGKIFGSAQRRGGDRFLAHGSLVLAPNPLCPGAVSLQERTGRAVPRQEAEEAVIRAWPEPLTAAAPTAAEWAAAKRLIAGRYGARAWTARR